MSKGIEIRSEALLFRVGNEVTVVDNRKQWRLLSYSKQFNNCPQKGNCQNERM
uniref:Uncharacterized protein n=1 Tax=Arundo donax TaxID=35708 RepID=A0A0A9AK23_ARUDO